jgi:glc operon protein GlcG
MPPRRHRAATLLLAPLLLLAAGKPPRADEPAPLVTRGLARLDLAGAVLVLDAARAKAAAMNLAVNIAVVDDGGHPIAFARMDGARPGSAYTAQTKAVSAALMRGPTGPFPPGVTEPDLLLNLSIQHTALAGGAKVTTLRGGVPLRVGFQVIGAIGVGGASGEQDAEIASAGAAALAAALDAQPAVREP